jgi:hypothetical protein
MPLPFVLATKESITRRPDAPVTVIAGPVPLIWLMAILLTLEAAPLAPEKVRLPLMRTPGAVGEPLIVSAPSVNSADA